MGYSILVHYIISLGFFKFNNFASNNILKSRFSDSSNTLI